MKIRLEIETTEDMPHTEAYLLAAQVLQADKLCREKYNNQFGPSHGDWVYSQNPKPDQYALKYRMEITK